MSPSHDSTDEASSKREGFAPLRFLSLHFALTAVLLIAFRHSIPSDAHIRYLYWVSESTASALTVMGIQSNVEGHRTHYSSKIIRDELVAWNLGTHVNPDSETPLSAWEYWRHSAEKKLRQQGHIDDFGPRVGFKQRDDTKTRTFYFRIVTDCGAIPSMIIFCTALVWASGSSWGKMVGIGLGLASVYLINIARLVTVAWIGAYDQTQDKLGFAFAHEHLWQVMLFVILAALWFMLAPATSQVSIRFRTLGKFTIRAVFIGPIAWVLWWNTLPGYAWTIGQLSGITINALSSETIVALRTFTEPYHYFNTGTSIIFETSTNEFPFAIVPLIAGVPAFTVLMLSTPGLAMKRRLISICAGIAALLAGQIAFISSAFIFREAMGSSPEIPTALGLLLMTLPFPLWIAGTWPDATNDSETPTPTAPDS